MSRTLHIVWTVVSVTPPRPLIHCSRCGREREFASSGKFRLNANGRKLDAWLVYRCSVCGDSFNRPVFERRNRGDVAPEMIEALHRNDAGLARRVGFDISGRWANGFRIFDDTVVERRMLSPSPLEAERLSIRIVADTPARARADRLIALGLGLSRGAVGMLAMSERLVIEAGGRKALSRPLRDGASVAVDLSGLANGSEIVRRAAGLEAD